jgi:hypothetical protein
MMPSCSTTALGTPPGFLPRLVPPAGVPSAACGHAPPTTRAAGEARVALTAALIALSLCRRRRSGAVGGLAGGRRSRSPTRVLRPRNPTPNTPNTNTNPHPKPKKKNKKKPKQKKKKNTNPKPTTQTKNTQQTPKKKNQHPPPQTPPKTQPNKNTKKPPPNQKPPPPTPPKNPPKQPHNTPNPPQTPTPPPHPPPPKNHPHTTQNPPPQQPPNQPPPPTPTQTKPKPKKNTPPHPNPKQQTPPVPLCSPWLSASVFCRSVARSSSQQLSRTSRAGIAQAGGAGALGSSRGVGLWMTPVRPIAAPAADPLLQAAVGAREAACIAMAVVAVSAGLRRTTRLDDARVQRSDAVRARRSLRTFPGSCSEARSPSTAVRSAHGGRVGDHVVVAEWAIRRRRSGRTPRIGV